MLKAVETVLENVHKKNCSKALLFLEIALRICKTEFIFDASVLLGALIEGISIKHVLVFEHKKVVSKFLGMNYSHSFEMKLFMLAMVSLFGNETCLMMKGREAKKEYKRDKKGKVYFG